jgi:hypothetical protein
MSYRLEFELLGLPKTTNSGGRAHWSVKAKEAKKWINLVWIHCRPRMPPTPLTLARLTLTRFSSQEPDFDGLVSSFKHVIDGLTACGVIASDKMSCIGQPIYKWEKIGLRKGKIRVTVETELCQQPNQLSKKRYL